MEDVVDAQEVKNYDWMLFWTGERKHDFDNK